jgi:hypothetical protein
VRVGQLGPHVTGYVMMGRSSMSMRGRVSESQSALDATIMRYTTIYNAAGCTVELSCNASSSNVLLYYVFHLYNDAHFDSTSVA